MTANMESHEILLVSDIIFSFIDCEVVTKLFEHFLQLVQRLLYSCLVAQEQHDTIGSTYLVCHPGLQLQF